MNSLHRQMIREVCENFKVGFNDILSRRREKKIVYAKKVIYWILRREGLTFNQIGKLLEKDHETIIVGIRSIPEELKPYALKIFTKYKKYFQQDEKNNKKEMRLKILNLLNSNYTVDDISIQTGLTQGHIKDQISLYFIKKLVPNYKTGRYDEKYFEKN